MKVSKAQIEAIDEGMLVKYAHYIAKFLLVLAFAYVIIFNPPIVEGKGMLLRMPLFLLPVILVPILSRVKKWDYYPHMGDLMITLPFLYDTVGNLFGWFDSIRIYDDSSHFLSWMFLILAYHAFRFYKVKDTRDAIMLGFGLGSILIIGWEFVEWAISVDGFGMVDALHLSYEDTIGDLVLSSFGGLIGSILGVKFFGPESRKKGM